MAEVWTPDFTVSGAGGDITAAIKDRLISLRVSDQAQDESDRLRLSLDDRRRESGAVLAWPQPKDVLSVAMGYRETGVTPLGDFRVDEITHSGPPDTLDVTGSGAQLAQQIRAKRTEAWHRDTYPTLGDIAETIAKRNGLSPKLDPALAAIPNAHADQTAESDIAFLHRLAQQHDAVARPVGDNLALVRKGTATAPSGAPLTTVALKLGAITRWQYSYAARREAGSAKPDRGAKKGGIRAYWQDRDAGKRRTVERGEAPFHEITWTFHSEAQARAAVASELNTATRGQSTLRLTLPGNPEIMAEGRVKLIGPEWRPDMPKLWRVVTVTHAISTQGYTTEVQAEEQPDQADVPADVAAAPPHPDDTL